MNSPEIKAGQQMVSINGDKVRIDKIENGTVYFTARGLHQSLSIEIFESWIKRKWLIPKDRAGREDFGMEF
jgi:hypothetical protein